MQAVTALAVCVAMNFVSVLTISLLPQAKASYNTALEMDSSDAAAKEGLATLQTITANLEQGAPPPPPESMKQSKPL